MSTYLITGTGKGVGLELTKQLLTLPSSEVTHIFALSRSKPTSGLQSLLDANQGRVTHITGAVDCDDSVQAAADEVTKLLDGKGLDVMVNNAGIGGASKTFKMEGYGSEHVNEFLNTNVTGVHRMTVAFLPLLREGREKKIINLCVDELRFASHLFGELKLALTLSTGRRRWAR